MLNRVYLFSGDSFLIEEKTKQLFSAIEKETGPNLSKQIFYLKDTSIQEILAQARTLPFMTDAQIFVIRECEKMKKDDLESLDQYCRTKSESAFLVFESQSVTAQSPLFELISRHGKAFLPEKGAGRPASSRYIDEKLRQFGKTMAPEARRQLENDLGDTPAFLDSVLNQLILYAGDKPEINSEMLSLFEETWAAADTFALVDAVVSGNTERSLMLFNDVVERGDGDLISLVGLLHWQLKRFWNAAVLLEEGQNEGSVLKKCKVYPKQAKAFMLQARKLRRASVERAIEGLFHLDWEIKTGQTVDLYGMERWIIGLGQAK